MIPFQVWLELQLARFPQVAAFMGRDWSWPIAESVHFVGLTLLFGTIITWDLRLIGVAKNVPIAAFHRLVPFAVLGFAINAASGALFLMTDADQYVYNPAFHLKMLCVLLAGANAGLFYLLMFKRMTRLDADGARLARFSGVLSIMLWTVVIVCGRMITFFRPFRCRPGQAVGLLADCIVR